KLFPYRDRGSSPVIQPRQLLVRGWCTFVFAGAHLVNQCYFRSEFRTDVLTLMVTGQVRSRPHPLRMPSTRRGLSSKAEPAPRFVMMSIGQPALISTKSMPDPIVSSRSCAHLARFSGCEPQ